MEVRIIGGSEVFIALRAAGFRNINAMSDGYMVYVTNVAQVQKLTEVALQLGTISR